MHLLFRESHDLDGQAMAEDLGHDPADLVLLSFSESDLLGLSDVHGAQDPGLRVATLSRLRHPMSVDLYLDQTIAHARCVVVRLLGGTEYWRYGVDELRALCRARDIPLAFITGEATPNPALKALSTVGDARWERLDSLFREGGARNLRCALTLMTRSPAWGKTTAPNRRRCRRQACIAVLDQIARVVCCWSSIGLICSLPISAASMRWRMLSTRLDWAWICSMWRLCAHRASFLFWIAGWWRSRQRSC